MKISDIKISEQIKASKPNEYKMNKCRKYYSENKKIDRDIVINKDGFLVDGYIGYLVLIENNVENVDVVVDENSAEHPRKSIYVFGTHKKDGEEYCWCVTNRTMDVINLAVGNRAIVKTKYGRKTIVIKRLEERTECPVVTKVKRVYKCLPN